MTGLGYLQRALADMPSPDDWLSPAERDIVAGLHVEKRRDDFLLGRWTAKCALERALGLCGDFRRWAVLPDADRVPRVHRDGLALEATLSISHSGGVALCAVSAEGKPVGCDIERIEVRDDAFVRTFLTLGERRAVHDASCDEERGALTTLIWSAKESVLKAMLKGLSIDTWSVDVTPPALPLALATRWLPLRARDVRGNNDFSGWWRREKDYVLTLIGLADEPPRDLDGSPDTAAVA